MGGGGITAYGVLHSKLNSMVSIKRFMTPERAEGRSYHFLGGINLQNKFSTIVARIYSVRLNELKEEVRACFGNKIYKMMSVKILIFSVWLSLAFGSSQSDKVV